VRRQRTVLVTAIVAALVAVAVGFQAGWGHPALWAVPGLAIAVGLCERYSTRVFVARQSLTLAFTDAFVAAALLLAPGAWLVAAVIIGYGTVLVARRVAWLKAFFNLANFASASAIAVLVTQSLGSGLLPAIGGLLAFIALNHLLLVVAVSLSTGKPYNRVLRDAGLLSQLMSMANASVGLLGGWLGMRQPIGLFGLVIPVGLLWWSYAQQAQRVAEARLFEELAQGHEQLLGASVDTSAQVVVTAAARMFGGAEVE